MANLAPPAARRGSLTPARSLGLTGEAARIRHRGTGSCHYPGRMCRNIRTLHNFEPPASDAEIRAAALQYVRKVTGTTRPSRANAEAFDRAVDEVALATTRLLDDLVTTAPPKDRDAEAAKRRERTAKRFAA
jgi:hypothetical protein